MTAGAGVWSAPALALIASAMLACNRGDGKAHPMMHDDEPGTADGMGGMMGDDGMMGRMPDWMMSDGHMMDPQMMRDMRVIHGLLMNHERIERRVEDVPGGIRSVTTSDDAHVAQLVRTHAWQMKARMEEGRPIRRMDPLFRKLFRHHKAIHMDIEEIEGGVRVTETSDDPRVTALIRQHAHRAVSEFVEDGMRRAMRPTPLPEGYSPTE